MPDNDVLLDLLGDPEIKTARKPDSMPGRDDGDGRHGGYDLTNPNLHHGVEDTYRPFHSSGPSGSSRLMGADGSHAPVSKPLHHEAGDSGPIANQTAYEGQALSIDVSGHFVAPVSGDTLDVLSFAARRPQHRCPYRRYLRGADRQ